MRKDDIKEIRKYVLRNSRISSRQPVFVGFSIPNTKYSIKCLRELEYCNPFTRTISTMGGIENELDVLFCESGLAIGGGYTYFLMDMDKLLNNKHLRITGLAFGKENF